MQRQGMMEHVLQGCVVIDRLGIKYKINDNKDLVRKLPLQYWKPIDYNILHAKYSGYYVITLPTKPEKVTTELDNLINALK